jgi:hypothetical protein
MPSKNALASTVAKIRPIIADEGKYPYLEDLVDPIETVLKSAPEAIPALVTDFLSDLNAVYRRDHSRSRFEAFALALAAMEDGSDSDFRYLCAAKVFVDEGESVADEVLDIIEITAESERRCMRPYKPPFAR